MLMLFGLSLVLATYLLINHKVRYRKQRRRLGLILIATGATATLLFDQKLHDFYIWVFVATWCTGLQLWFNCEKYGGHYP
jgi:hypothetical protein